MRSMRSRHNGTSVWVSAMRQLSERLHQLKRRCIMQSLFGWIVCFNINMQGVPTRLLGARQSDQLHGMRLRHV